jgi:predicted nucleotidyltransferase
MVRNQHILSKVKNRIHNFDPSARIFLFGSRARNDYRDDSDWDFLILTNQRVTQGLKNKISDLLFETELDTDQVLTSIIQNVNSWEKFSNTPIYRNVKRDSIEI